MGRSASGVRSIVTQGDDYAVGMEVLRPGATILTVTQNGYGKRSPLEQYREQKRGGQGIITIKTTARNGPVIGILQVTPADEIMLISSGGKILRMEAREIPSMGRNTQGVRVMVTNEGEDVVSIARVAERDEEKLEAAPTPPQAEV